MITKTGIRGGVQPWDYQGQRCANAKRKAFYYSLGFVPYSTGTIWRLAK